MTASTVALPGGFWLDGVHHREAELRPLTGRDEVFLLEEGAALPPARRATALLARCLARLGPWRTAALDTVSALTAGDREALLLHLRRLSLGERLECVLRCPEPACGERMDLDLRVADLLVPPYPDARPWYETAFEEGGRSYRARFRLPTGADQEETAALALTDPWAAADAMLRRCLDRLATDEGEPVGEIPPRVAERLADLMSDLDPQAELRLELTCPVCGRSFSTLFDAAAFLFQELAGRRASLYREVHRLAFHYHWSETEILAMTGRKRRIYLGLLAEALGGEAW